MGRSPSMTTLTSLLRPEWRSPDQANTGFTSHLARPQAPAGSHLHPLPLGCDCCPPYPCRVCAGQTTTRSCPSPHRSITLVTYVSADPCRVADSEDHNPIQHSVAQTGPDVAPWGACVLPTSPHPISVLYFLTQNGPASGWISRSGQDASQPFLQEPGSSRWGRRSS